jgi:hypothetical protein
MVDFSSLRSRTPSEKLEDHKRMLLELEKEEKEYSEFITDAVSSPKLNDWERTFIASLHAGYSRKMVTRFEELSSKQAVIARRIRTKIYAVG